MNGRICEYPANAQPFALLIKHETKYTRIIRHDHADNRMYDIIVPKGHPVEIAVVDNTLIITRGQWTKINE